MPNELHGEATGNANGMIGLMLLFVLLVLLTASTVGVARVAGSNPTNEP